MDGSVQREREGVTYKEINRDRMLSFRLVMPGETLLETFVPDGATGKNFVYRRRTVKPQEGTARTVFLFGWQPMGPMILVDPTDMSYRVEAGFIEGDPDMSPPTPHPSEGEFDSFTAQVHRTDALLLPGDFAIPAFRQRSLDPARPT
jgi:hypothetical protein